MCIDGLDRKLDKWCVFSRLRHFHGHGIHSPFVYELVRKVFVSKRFLDNKTELYNDLLRQKISKKTARKLQNLHTFCSSPSYAIVGESNRIGDELFRIIMHGADRAAIKKTSENADVTFVVVNPYKEIYKRNLCDSIVSSGKRLTIDAKQIFIIFDQDKEPKQHFKI